MARQLSLFWRKGLQDRKLGAGEGPELSQFVRQGKLGVAVELAPLEKVIHKKNLLVQILLSSSVHGD